MVVWTVLAQSCYLMGVKVSEVPTGFCLTAEMSRSALGNWERALSMAKQALLDAASRSANIYVLGYKARPFTQTATGFEATLAKMPIEEESVCWTTFEEGHCVRGPACCW